MCGEPSGEIDHQSSTSEENNAIERLSYFNTHHKHTIFNAVMPKPSPVLRLLLTIHSVVHSRVRSITHTHTKKQIKCAKKKPKSNREIGSAMEEMGGTQQKWMFLNYYYWRSAFVLSHQTLPFADLNKFHSNVFHSLSTSHLFFFFFSADGWSRHTNITMFAYKNQKSLIYIFCCNAVCDDVDDDNDEVVNDAGSWKVNEFICTSLCVYNIVGLQYWAPMPDAQVRALRIHLYI